MSHIMQIIKGGLRIRPGTAPPGITGAGTAGGGAGTGAVGRGSSPGLVGLVAGFGKGRPGTCPG